jgi:hypothetical protein
MDQLDDYCDLCDLPRSQCVHGRPPAPPAPVVKPTAARTSPPRATRVTTTRKTTPDRAVPRRWSPPETFKPLILAVLRDAGGELEVDEAFLEIEILAEDVFLAGDRERTPEGELRWQYAARRARMELIADGSMTKAAPGIWKLS